MTTMVEGFWLRVGVSSLDVCWEWRGCRTKQGYGSLTKDKKSWKAHRLAWTLHNQTEIPPGMFICHRCDNPPCCNPHHLFVGTAHDNMRDMVAKGRHVRPQRDESKVPRRRGETSNMAKLLPSQVMEIRELRAGGMKQRDVAAIYGVHWTLISQLDRKLIWRHLP